MKIKVTLLWLVLGTSLKIKLESYCMIQTVGKKTHTGRASPGCIIIWTAWETPKSLERWYKKAFKQYAEIK